MNPPNFDSIKVILLGVTICMFMCDSIRRKSDRRLEHLLKGEPSIGPCNQARAKLKHQINLVIGLPSVPRICKIYFLISSITHLVNILICTVNYLQIEEYWFGSNTINCHSPRFVFQVRLGSSYTNALSSLFSSLHLVWRFIMLYIKREFELNIISYLFWNEKNINHSTQPGDGSTKDRILQELRQNILYVRFEDGTRTKTLLRPNRTEESQVRLVEIFQKRAIQVGLLILIMGFVLGPPAIWSMFTAHDFYYKGCTISYYNTYYWIRSLSTLYLSSMLFYECSLAILLPPVVVTIWIEDIIIYWETIKIKLTKLNHKLMPYRMPSGYKFNRSTASSLKELNAMSHLISDKFSDNLFVKTPCLLEKLTNQNDILEVQMLLGDFFKELRRLDQYVSTMLTFSVCMWFACNGFLSMLGLQLDSFGYICRGLQVLGMIIMSIVSRYCLSVIANTEPAYKIICSLVASDPSVSKQRWLSILEHYTGRPSYGFSFIYSSRMFTSVTLLQVFAYTVSFIFVLETLFQHRTALN